MNLINEMISDLLKMIHDDYEESRNELLAVARSDNTRKFVVDLFEYTDKRRPLLIERKADVAILNYPVIGTVKRKDGTPVPLVDIPMMSDESWRELARENAVHNYRRINGCDPETVDDAVKWQKEMLSRKREDGELL